MWGRGSPAWHCFGTQKSMGIVTMHERKGIDRVLNAAALTYVAAAVSTLLTLLYFLWRAGLIGGRR